MNLNKSTSLKFIYNGHLPSGCHPNCKSCLHLDKLVKEFNLFIPPSDKGFIYFCQNFASLNHCYVIIREEGSFEWNYKPSMKIAHAAICKSNIIITNDMTTRDLLGDDYPYLLDNSKYETVKKMFQYVI